MIATATPAAGTDPAARLDDLLAHLGRGQVIEAFHRFYAPDVRMQENEQPPTVGFAANLVREQLFLASIAEWHGFKVFARGAGGDHTFYESISERTHRVTGRRTRLRRVSIARWSGGRIVEERFVYDTAAP